MECIISPRKRFDIVKDPVHGYIRFTRDKLSIGEKATEADLINSDWMQRLRRIRQLQTAWYVYPAADHTRFAHALGVMELAGKFARTVYEPFYKHLNGKIDEDPLPEVEHVVETFRVAGLLHDIGHGPLTHLLDRKFLMPHYDITHEVITSEIITKDFKKIIEDIRRSPGGCFEEPLDINVIKNLIRKGGERNLDFIWKPLHQIIRGAYDADKMDFLLRDGLLCGEMGISNADVDRLMFTSLLHKRGNSFQLHHSSLPLLFSLIRFRQHMFETVYYHRTVRAIELMVEDNIEYVLKKLIPVNPINNLREYKKLDEYAFFQHLKSLKESRDTVAKSVAQVWSSIFRRNIRWKQLDDQPRAIHDPKEIHTHLNASELAARIENDTGKKPDGDFIIDSPPVETPGNVFSFSQDLTDRDKLMIFYENRPPQPAHLDNLAAKYRIPIKAIQYRLYVSDSIDPKEAQTIRDSFRKHLGEHGYYTSSTESSY